MPRVLTFSIFSMLLIASTFLVRGQEGENHAPFVSNVHAEQRPGTKLVDISYDVDDTDGDLLTITVVVSDDGGQTFTVPASTFTGDVGAGIAPGTGKQIVWDAGADVPNVFGTNYQIKLTASDGQLGGETIIGQDGAPMALIPAGEFQMGDAFSEGNTNERPVHTVYLDAFYMDVHEVTVGQYRQFVQATGYRAPNWNSVASYAPTDEHPIIYVSWNDATAYCEWAGKRLPTEAEWEKAARGGLAGNRYPWGNDISHDDANYNGTSGQDQWSNTSPVGSFAPNGYGLHDMSGNVWEWCADWYSSGYYASSPRENPIGPNSSSYRVLRGGSWSNLPYALRIAYRNVIAPTNSNGNIGFRCAQGSF